MGVVVKRFFATSMLLTGLFAAGGADSAATITFSQVGNDVQATLTGTLSLTGLIADGAGISPNARVRGAGLGASVILGPSTITAATSYSVITGPQTIGCSTDNIDASSGSAAPNGPFGFNMSNRRLIVRNGFVSGNNVSGSATWSGATIGSLGLTSGTYVYTWAGDSLTIIIPGPGGCQSAAAIPTLSSRTLLMLGLMVMIALGGYNHKREDLS